MNADWYERSKLNGYIGVDHNLKKDLVVDLGETYEINTFVETGTAHGDLTAHAARNHYDLVHTIEMQQEYYDFAKAKLSRFPYVFCHLGNSSDVLPWIVAELDGAGAVFFLDAHYSGPGTACGETATPVMSELDAIGIGKNIVIIDDARHFDGMAFHDTEGVEDYPHVDELERWALSHGYSFSFTCDDFVLISDML